MSESPNLAPWGTLAIHDELQVSYLGHTQFGAIVLEQGLAHIAYVQWSTSERGVDAVLDSAVTTGRIGGRSWALLDLDAAVDGRCVAIVSISNGWANVYVAAREREDLDTAERFLRDRLPELKPSEEPRVHVTFWSLGSQCARATTRTIDVGSWADIAGNYPASVRDPLERLMGDEFRPAHGGQLVLWHGDPGTGKTSALRALSWAWREWCDTHYVTDPEDFFGKAAYMLDVLLNDNEEDDEDGETSGRWRLLVLEDTGELLSADAKERTGQGLSRLLNVVDGIIGQGLRVLVLVTTNEPLRSLHPAVARPGRCAAQVEFAPFSAEEAETWLAERGLPIERPVPRTLAALFAAAKGVEAPKPRTIGFVR